MKPHKHAELIKAWADGAKIEFFSEFSNGWREATRPNFDEGTQYRIKPEPKPLSDEDILQLWVKKNKLNGASDIIEFAREIRGEK